MLTFFRDEFIVSTWEDTSRWVVQLNDGTGVYQDDTRPEKEYKSWQELRDYCKIHDLYITDMHIEFRDHIERLPSNKRGYFFTNVAGGMWGSPTFRYFKIGYVDDTEDIIHVLKYSVPELVNQEHSTRPVNIDDPCLILRK